MMAYRMLASAWAFESDFAWAPWSSENKSVKALVRVSGPAWAPVLGGAWERAVSL
jgi:hypothetical protein